MCLALGYLGYLGYTLLESSLDYYLTVSELKGKGESVYDQKVRVNGEIVSGSINSEPENLTLTFTITDGTENMDVIYKGSMPDNFGKQSQVVLEGKLDSTQIFYASLIVTKCPSTYEAE